MKHIAFCTAFLATWVVIAGVGSAADGWNLMAWNPFDRDDRVERPGARVSDSGAAIGSSRAAARPPIRREPSMWTKMNRGTKTFFAKTKDVLTPWDNEEPQRASLTGSRGFSYRSKPQKEKSFLESLFQPESEEQRIETVKDFLDQPRPLP